MAFNTVGRSTRGVRLLEDGGATGDWVTVAGGEYVLSLEGDLDGEMATIEVAKNDGTTGLATDVTLSDEGTASIVVGDNTTLRVAISTGGGTPSGLYVDLRAI